MSVWLNGPPALLAHRVVGDGTETRPLLSQVRLGVEGRVGWGWGGPQPGSAAWLASTQLPGCQGGQGGQGL